MRFVAPEVLEIHGWDDSLAEFVGNAGWETERLADRLFVYTDHGNEVYRDLASRFQADQLLLRHGTLEDVFLRLTGRELRECRGFRGGRSTSGGATSTCI